MPALARPFSAPTRFGVGFPRTGSSWPAIRGYALVKQLAAGRWCEVYLARPYDLSCGAADYVIKTTRVNSTEREFACALLQREATVAANALHPNLISVLDANWVDENPYLVLPHVQGSLLADLACQERPISVPQALWYLRQAAAALAALHAQGWLHGDVKPSNVIVSEQGHVTLIDLGLARRLDSAECRADRWLAGDAEFLAPEAFIPSSQLTGTSDIYSLGLTLLRLLLGDRCSAGAFREGIAELRAQRPDVPREVATLITRMTAAEPLRRPSANELVDVLTRLEIESLMQW